MLISEVFMGSGTVVGKCASLPIKGSQVLSPISGLPFLVFHLSITFVLVGHGWMDDIDFTPFQQYLTQSYQDSW